MAVLCLDDARILHDGFDLSGLANEVEASVSFDELDVTTFGSQGWRDRKAGLVDGSVSVSGFYDAALDADLFSKVGAAGALSVSSGNTVGDVAYIASSVEGAYQWGGSVGDVVPMSVDFMTSGQLARGALLSGSAGESGSGVGAGVELGALAAGQLLSLNLHVMSISGGTLTMRLESDSAAGFPSPATQFTFAGVSAGPASLSGGAVGPVTDTFWRADWTFTGSAVVFALVAGIVTL